LTIKSVQGFLNLHKPLGMTSHDCVGAIRRIFGIRKVGHGGTLDPMATGVLPIAMGRVTRLIPYLAADKAYEAVIRFGLTTTTDDLEGDSLTQTPVPQLSLEQIRPLLAGLEGTIEQVPPAFSAVQVQGQRLYHLARKGHPVTPPTRTVTIHRLTVKHWQPGDYPELTLTIDCGPGTYIRSIARDLGQLAGTGATLAQLIRTRSSGFCLEHSLSLDAVKMALEQQTLTLISPETVLHHLPAIALPPDLARRWCQGQKLAPPTPIPPQQSHRILTETGEFLGIGELQMTPEAVILKAKMVFKG
jgi:tRNA pseudouridine55 synthase